jgi:putative addiction module antidote
MKSVVKSMERKITRVGNSLGVTLPQEVLDHIKVKQGDEIKFKLEPNGNVTIKKYVPINYDVLDKIDQDFLDGMKDLFDNYDNTLRNLVDR